jgi:hypothetical protein
LIDGATKGEIAREVVNLEAKAVAKEGEAARTAALEKLNVSFASKLDFTGLRLLGALDCNRVKIRTGGKLELLSPSRVIDFKAYRSLQLRLVAKSDGSSVESTLDLGHSGSGRFDLSQDGKLSVGWSEKFSVGDILWFIPTNE